MARVQLDLPTSFVFETVLGVRVTDINYGGHLGNDRVLALIHEARARFFKFHGLSEMDIDGLGIVVADAVLVYKSEAFYGDRIRIQLAAQDFNRYGCDMVYLLTNVDNNREVARAKTGIVFFDYSVRKIASAPARFLHLFPNSEDVTPVG